MATLKRNVLTTSPECGVGNKGDIDNRMSDDVTTQLITDLKSEMALFGSTVAASSDPKIVAFKKATSFPIADITAILEANPDCKYLRVYNGIDSAGNYVTYLAPVNNDFQSYLTAAPENDTVITKSCCHCNPCTSDVILGN